MYMYAYVYIYIYIYTHICTHIMYMLEQRWYVLRVISIEQRCITSPRQCALRSYITESPPLQLTARRKPELVSLPVSRAQTSVLAASPWAVACKYTCIAGEGQAGRWDGNNSNSNSNNNSNSNSNSNSTSTSKSKSKSKSKSTTTTTTGVLVAAHG